MLADAGYWLCELYFRQASLTRFRPLSTKHCARHILRCRAADGAAASLGERCRLWRRARGARFRRFRVSQTAQ